MASQQLAHHIRLDWTASACSRDGSFSLAAARATRSGPARCCKCSSLCQQEVPFWVSRAAALVQYDTGTGHPHGATHGLHREFVMVVAW